jgi:hypothetical protein
MGEKKAAKAAVRCIAAVLIAFSAAFGCTWRKSGYCLGDHILSGLGLKAWSNGTQGTHYAAIYALALLLIGFLLFAATTQRKARTFRYFVIGSIAVLILCSLFSLAI